MRSFNSLTSVYEVGIQLQAKPRLYRVRRLK